MHILLYFAYSVCINMYFQSLQAHLSHSFWLILLEFMVRGMVTVSFRVKFTLKQLWFGVRVMVTLTQLDFRIRVTVRLMLLGLRLRLDLNVEELRAQAIASKPTLHLPLFLKFHFPFPPLPFSFPFPHPPLRSRVHIKPKASLPIQRRHRQA